MQLTWEEMVMLGGYVITRRGVAAILAGLLTTSATCALAQSTAREDTLILAANSQGPEFGSVANANPYAPGNAVNTAPHLAYEGLFYFNSFTGETVPWLATDASYNDDFTRLTVTIRDDALWSDDTPFSANDVAFTIEMLRENGKGPANLISAVDIASQVSSVSADGNTVVIDFIGPAPRFLQDYLVMQFNSGLWILPRHVFETVEDVAAFTFFDKDKGWPVVTGAYDVSSWTSTEINLERRDDWWGKQVGFRPLPEVERIIAVPFNNADRGAQLVQTNAADITRDLPVGLIRPLVQDNPAITTFTGTNEPFGNVDWWPTSLYFNSLSAPFDDLRVRKAVALALERGQLIDFAYENAAEASLTPFPAFGALKPYIEVAESLAAQRGLDEQNLNQSAALMEDAGFTKNANGFWEREGAELKSEIHSINLLGQIGTLAAEQLKRAGFNVTFVSAADSVTRIRDGRAQMSLWGHHGSIGDPYATLNSYTCAQVKPIGEAVYPFFSRWCDPAYDEIVAEIRMLAPDNQAEIMPLYTEAMGLWYDGVPEVPLTQWYHRLPMNTTYWSNWPTAENPYIQPAFWLNTGAYLVHNLKKSD